MSKLKPIRTIFKRDENVKSVKRSQGLNRDTEVASPYVDGRENPNMINMSKIRQSRILKNAENELLNNSNEASTSKTTIEARK